MKLNGADQSRENGLPEGKGSSRLLLSSDIGRLRHFIEVMRANLRRYIPERVELDIQIACEKDTGALLVGGIVPSPLHPLLNSVMGGIIADIEEISKNQAWYGERIRRLLGKAKEILYTRFHIDPCYVPDPKISSLVSENIARRVKEAFLSDDTVRMLGGRNPGKFENRYDAARFIETIQGASERLDVLLDIIEYRQFNKQMADWAVDRVLTHELPFVKDPADRCEFLSRLLMSVFIADSTQYSNVLSSKALTYVYIFRTRHVLKILNGIVNLLWARPYLMESLKLLDDSDISQIQAGLYTLKKYLDHHGEYWAGQYPDDADVIDNRDILFSFLNSVACIKLNDGDADNLIQTFWADMESKGYFIP